MAAKKPARRAAGPGRHPTVAYARIVIALYSLKGTKEETKATVLIPLPTKHRSSDVGVSVVTVETLVPKG